MRELQRENYLELFADIEKKMSSLTPSEQEMYFFKVINHRGSCAVDDFKKLASTHNHPMICSVIERLYSNNRDIAPIAHTQLVKRTLSHENLNLFNKFRANSPETIGEEDYKKMIKVIDDLTSKAGGCTY